MVRRACAGLVSQRSLQIRLLEARGGHRCGGGGGAIPESEPGRRARALRVMVAAWRACEMVGLEVGVGC